MHPALRLKLAALACLTPAAPIGARLVQLQVLAHESFRSRVSQQSERSALEIIPRGRILDREGRELAQSLPAWSSTLDTRLLKDKAPTAARIAKALGLDAAEVAAKARSTRRGEWLKRKMTLEETEALRALRIPAVAIVSDERRVYPNGELARGLLGSVSADGRGSAGLEFEFNRELSGSSRRIELTRDVAGNPIVLDGPAAAAPAPPDLRLSIDRNVQHFAEEAIREAVLEHRAKRGIVLVQEPASGELLAVASYPSDPAHNPAIQEVYEPGSTFKIVVAAAALEAGLTPSGERVDCEGGRWELTPSVTIKDHEALGPATLEEIVSRSSNIGSGKLGLRLGAKAFLRACRLFGFGYKTGIPFPAESAGILRVPGGDGGTAPGDPVRLANAAFGQGVAVTPLQLVGAFSAVANGGELMEPRLVLSLGAEPPRPPLRLRRVFSAQTAEALRGMLELVVQKGTGLTARIPGYRVAGKTGTAQKLDPALGRYSATDYVSSFAGFAPAASPRFSILVIVDSPQGKHYGSEVAAPVFTKLGRQLLALRGIQPDTPLPLTPARAVSEPPPTHPAPPRQPTAPARQPPALPRPSLLKGTG